MEVRDIINLQNEYGVSDEDMYEWLLNMDKPLAKKFDKHLKAFQKVLDSVAEIEAKFQPGYKPHSANETSENMRHRSDNMRSLVQQLDRQDNLKPEAKREWLDR